MKVSGKGRRKILVVAEAPGSVEDIQGVQLVGNSGKELENTFRKVGIDMRKDCWLTNALICRPHTKGDENRKPTDKEITYCYPNLAKTLKELQPEIIVPLGEVALKSLLTGIWTDKIGAITRWVGSQIPCQKLNAWICPTYHPSYLLRAKDPVLDKMFLRHLKAVSELDGRPWMKATWNFPKAISTFMNPDDAADILRGISTKDGISFDFETNMLKPDSTKSKILCCSISNGKETIAFPWVGKAVDQMERILHGPCGKIAANFKFEERWTRKEFGKGVNNWKWDTMLAAHWLDNREGVTGLKFQSFVQLGYATYNDYVKPFLTSTGGNIPNKIDQADLSKVLQYCAMDSYLTWKLAQIQMGMYEALKPRKLRPATLRKPSSCPNRT